MTDPRYFYFRDNSQTSLRFNLPRTLRKHYNTPPQTDDSPLLKKSTTKEASDNPYCPINKDETANRKQPFLLKLKLNHAKIQ